MSQQQPKLPQKGGVQKAVDAIKKFRKQPPCERLIKIISEIPEIENDKSKSDIAARDAEIK